MESAEFFETSILEQNARRERSRLRTRGKVHMGTLVDHELTAKVVEIQEATGLQSKAIALRFAVMLSHDVIEALADGKEVVIGGKPLILHCFANDRS